MGEFNASLLEKNLRALADVAPELAQRLKIAASPHAVSNEHISSTVGESGLPVIVFDGLPLDQIDKPHRAGEVWAERTLGVFRSEQPELLVAVGIGGGYHLEALLTRTKAAIYLVEPREDLLLAALSLRDCTVWLAGLSGVVTSSKEIEELLKRDAKYSLGELSQRQILLHPQSIGHCREISAELRRFIGSKQGLSKLNPSIAVVSPLYGGSLPIAAYVARALHNLGQRVQLYDLSSFFQAFANLGAYISERGRVEALQGTYVEMMSQLVLEAVTEKPVDIVISLAQAPLSGRVLTELRKRGVITSMWFVEDCRRFSTWKDISRYYDYMFLIQNNEFLEKVHQAGAARAVYLPTGCDPNVHRPLVLTPEEHERWGSAVSFVGAGYNNRVQMLSTLVGRDFKIWGTEWPIARPFDKLVQEQGRRLDPSDYVKIFNATAVNLNLHSSMERDGVEPNGDFLNPRTFELASCGAFQLVDRRLPLAENFVLGEELSVFNDRKQLEDGIDYALANPEWRAQVASRGRERALRDHTYQQRVEQMLGHIYADHYDALLARQRSNPWTRTLEAAKSHPELVSRFEAAFKRGDEPKLDSLIKDITTGKGKLTDTESKLLFLHHVKKQISYVNNLRAARAQ